MPRGGDKSFAYAAAFGGADGDVLQVGVVAGKPPCYGYGLRVVGVDAACGGERQAVSYTPLTPSTTFTVQIPGGGLLLKRQALPRHLMLSLLPLSRSRRSHLFGTRVPLDTLQ